MRHEVEAHQRRLSGLGAVDDDRQLFFALWCLDVPLRAASAFLRGSLSISAQKQLEVALSGLWRCCINDEAVRVVEIVDFVMSELPGPAEFGNPTFEEAAAFVFLEGLSAAAACEAPLDLAITCGLDAVDFVDGDEKDKLAEVERQAVMVDVLLSAAPLSLDLRHSTRLVGHSPSP
jgi:hypothetical protein